MPTRLPLGISALAASITALACVSILAVAHLRLKPPSVFPPDSGAIQSGREWQVVYIGNSLCWASRHPRVAPAVQTIVRVLSRQAMSINDAYSSIGIATDTDHQEGRRHLAKIGDFSQVGLGGVWQNFGLSHYQELLGDASAATPTVLVLYRTLEINAQGETVVSGESVAVHLSGINEIQAYAAWLTGDGPEPVLGLDQESSLDRSTPTLVGDDS